MTYERHVRALAFWWSLGGALGCFGALASGASALSASLLGGLGLLLGGLLLILIDHSDSVRWIGRLDIIDGGS